MSDKRRDLPSWMLGGDAKRNEKGEFRKSVPTLEKKKRTGVQRETLYFMNEAELVDAALRVLTEGGGGNPGTGTRALQHKTEAEKNTREWLAKTNGDSIKRKKQPMFESDTEEESSGRELSKETCISETDPEDLAEKATLPYAPALEPGERGAEGAAERDAEEPALPGRGVAPEPDRGSASPGASDDEALRLVREIFFT
ncbi:cell cycle regulator of non-homologous end joining isoform X1 [Anguilla anguilla]|uniref:cell cycle regulator of non-homologous end joining isoform X1 n=1 Tax=Anguilla anguilla TaxID=7936 RepID=UPI0015A9E9AE|nr:cell cycle regulator of non-homologous end joining isoform X1 [Anguilla anguilla]